MKKIVVLVALLLLPVVYAEKHGQLDWSVTDLRCGDGVLDRYELCEKGVNESRCDDLAKNMSIAMACDEKHCTCLPRINPVYCGNKRRDIGEMCDPPDPSDLCPWLGQLMNVSLVCNPKTCGCTINETIPLDYNPVTLGVMSNLSEKTAVCGDKKVERDEECDPPNTLCTTKTNQPGICTDKCKCVLPEMIGVEEKPKEEANITPVTNVTENLTENVTEKPVEKAPEKPGFFARLWEWIVSLFS